MTFMFPWRLSGLNEVFLYHLIHNISNGGSLHYWWHFQKCVLGPNHQTIPCPLSSLSFWIWAHQSNWVHQSKSLCCKEISFSPYDYNLQWQQHSSLLPFRLLFPLPIGKTSFHTHFFPFFLFKLPWANLKSQNFSRFYFLIMKDYNTSIGDFGKYSTRSHRAPLYITIIFQAGKLRFLSWSVNIKFSKIKKNEYTEK